MCGRFGSTFTVWDSPVWLVSPISLGFVTLVMSTSSRPPRGWVSVPSAEES
jgi:hypothetical protein